MPTQNLSLVLTEGPRLILKRGVPWRKKLTETTYLSIQEVWVWLEQQEGVENHVPPRRDHEKKDEECDDHGIREGGERAIGMYLIGRSYIKVTRPLIMKGKGKEEEEVPI